MQIKKENFSKNSMDFILLITVILLLSLGIIMVLSASSPSALAQEGNSYKYVVRQAIFAILGFIAMIVISKYDYHNYDKGKRYILIYVGCVILLALVPLIGVETNGAKRWIDLGFTTFQPSELVKLGLILFYASLLTRIKDKLKHIGWGFFYPLALLIPIIGILIVFQTHMSASLIIIILTGILMLMAGTRIAHCIVVGVPAAAALLAAILLKGEGFRMGRVMTWLDPWSDLTGDGWQIVQSLYAVGSGGLFGAGLGNSKQKYLYIPEPHNDFIFAVLAEELGFVGCFIVIALFAVFIWRGIVIAMKAPDMFGSLTAIGITSLIGIQVIINIAVVTNSMPVTGMPLPFFSYGGTALMIILASVGVLLNISRAGNKL